MQVRRPLADTKSTTSACAAPSQFANLSWVGKAATHNPDELVLLCSLAFLRRTWADRRIHGKFRFGHITMAGFSKGSIPLPLDCRRQHLHRRRTGKLALCGRQTCIDLTLSCLFFPLPLIFPRTLIDEKYCTVRLHALGTLALAVLDTEIGADDRNVEMRLSCAHCARWHWSTVVPNVRGLPPAPLLTGGLCWCSDWRESLPVQLSA